MVYCQRTNLPLARSKPRIDDRLVKKASEFWTKWSNSDKQWKKTIVGWADRAMENISYDEWSLKTIPAKDAIMRRTKEKEHVTPAYVHKQQLKSHDMESIVVEYPSQLMSTAQASGRLKSLAERGLSHHRRYMWLSLIGAPLTLPVAAIPVIPNLPGFYLLFRAWSHWKALEGAKHLAYLVNDGHLTFIENQALNEVAESAEKAEEDCSSDQLLLTEGEIDALATRLDAKDMGPELHRALHQVKKQITKEQKERKQNA
ncbi:hypothetical protein TRVA0_026S02234 [Trichomonascus vanleenenianus]|uniref:Mrx19p n=1 Tax=Trichomonascus vanleenenianus TaxID=2268995 RepID=UPI003EC966DC